MDKEPWKVFPLKVSKSTKCFDTLAASCTLILCLFFFLLHQFAICENLYPVAESPPAERQAGTLRYTRVARAVENSPLPRDNPDWIRLDQASLHAAARKKSLFRRHSALCDSYPMSMEHGSLSWTYFQFRFLATQGVCFSYHRATVSSNFESIVK